MLFLTNDVSFLTIHVAPCLVYYMNAVAESIPLLLFFTFGFSHVCDMTVSSIGTSPFTGGDFILFGYNTTTPYNEVIRISAQKIVSILKEYPYHGVIRESQLVKMFNRTP